MPGVVGLRIPAPPVGTPQLFVTGDALNHKGITLLAAQQPLQSPQLVTVWFSPVTDL